MPRHATLQKKDAYWFTKAGAPNGKYFGRTDEVTHRQAKAAFADYLKMIAAPRRSHAAVTVAELAVLFLDAVEEHRGGRTYEERRHHLERFISHPRGTGELGEVFATAIHAEDLISFLEHGRQHGFPPKNQKLDPFTVHKHAISVIAAFNWGAGAAHLKNPTPCLPAGFRPFTNMERYKAAPKELLESELPTADEIGALFDHADDDLEVIVENSRYRQRRPDEFRHGRQNPYQGFADLLRVYHATGARTSELAHAKVKNFSRNARQIVLAQHKRSKTMRQAATRRIMLNDVALAIVDRLCARRQPDDSIFTDPKGRPWEWRRLDQRFHLVRERAKVRDSISIYGLRHLWISEMLMHGNDIATVAKMAGTSVAMIETVYGHFKGEHFAEALSKLDAGRSSA